MVQTIHDLSDNTKSYVIHRLI